MARKPRKISIGKPPKFKTPKLGRMPHVKVRVPKPGIKKQKANYK